jgi:nucleoside-diphosphate-sugar epimerase
MKILLTGGAGDLAAVIAHKMTDSGHELVLLDIRTPQHSMGTFVNASIEDFAALKQHFQGVDCVVHIAAWHGIHENNIQVKKNTFDFFNLNVKGTFHVFEAAVQAQVPNVLFISSTSTDAPETIYGSSKLIGEQYALEYALRTPLNVMVLRPRAFIPHWNPVYSNFVDWLKWFWKGAVHIDDVAQAVTKGVNALSQTTFAKPLTLNVDGAYQYTLKTLHHWKKIKVFETYYPEFVDLAKQHGLPMETPPTILDMWNTRKVLNYDPQYSLRNALEELRDYGIQGPPPPAWLKR